MISRLTPKQLRTFIDSLNFENDSIRSFFLKLLHKVPDFELFVAIIEALFFGEIGLRDFDDPVSILSDNQDSIQYPDLTELQSIKDTTVQNLVSKVTIDELSAEDVAKWDTSGADEVKYRIGRSLTTNFDAEPLNDVPLNKSNVTVYSRLDARKIEIHQGLDRPSLEDQLRVQDLISRLRRYL